MRQQFFFAAGDVDHREFEAFGAVQGHELDGVFFLFLAVEDVEQGEVLHQAVQGFKAFFL